MADHQGLITGPQTVKHGGKEKSVRHTHMRNNSHSVRPGAGITLNTTRTAATTTQLL